MVIFKIPILPTLGVPQEKLAGHVSTIEAELQKLVNSHELDLPSLRDQINTLNKQINHFTLNIKSQKNVDSAIREIKRIIDGQFVKLTPTPYSMPRSMKSSLLNIQLLLQSFARSYFNSKK